MGKVNVGICIDEVLRAKWLQFDRYYRVEFGESGVPEKVYVYDFFENYKFVETEEKIRELREPGDMPETISPIDYQVNDKTGEAPADAFLFKKETTIKLSAREVYNRFMYEDYLFEIHGAAPGMYKNIDVDVSKFLKKYDSTANFTILSVENYFSIPSTLFFLSKTLSRFKNYRFVNDAREMWKGIDVLITTDPKLLKAGAPWGKKLIKLKRPYNDNIKSGVIEVLHIADLIDNPKFEKIIKYKKQSK